jgi:hypothetical protein
MIMKFLRAGVVVLTVLCALTGMAQAAERMAVKADIANIRSVRASVNHCSGRWRNITRCSLLKKGAAGFASRTSKATRDG